MTAAISERWPPLSLLLRWPAAWRWPTAAPAATSASGRPAPPGSPSPSTRAWPTCASWAAGGLRLWAQAPALSLVTRDAAAAAAPLAITLDNVLADAQLLDEAGQPLAADPGDEPFATRRRFLLPAGPASQRLTLRPPDADRRERFRIGVFADVQERIADVGDIYARMNQDPSIRFILMSGDLTNRGTYNSSTASSARCAP